MRTTEREPIMVDPDWFMLANRALVNSVMRGVRDPEDRLDLRQELRILAGEVLREQPDPYKARVPFFNRGRNIAARYRRNRARMAVETRLEAIPTSEPSPASNGLLGALVEAGLDEREMAVASALAAGLGKDDAAVAAGVSKETLHRCVIRIRAKLIASGIVEKTATS